MNKLILNTFFILLVFITTAEAAAPDWTVTPSDYQYSLTITAVLNIDGISADQSEDKVAVFLDGVCRGVASPSAYSTADGRKLVFLQVYSNAVSGEILSFKLYDASKDQQFDAVNTIEFSNDASLGSPNDPYVVTTNNNPVDISLSSNTIMEGTATGTTIGNFSATDPDPDSPVFSYSLVSGTGSDDNSSFSISGIDLVSANVFDYDLKNVYSIRVQVNDGKGGVFEKQFAINVVPDPAKFSALNYISPNGDGKNDVWEIKNYEVYKDFQVTIFNDAGINIFSTKDYQNNWNGEYEGKDLPAGVYFYLVEHEDGKKFTGSITLNR